MSQQKGDGGEVRFYEHEHEYHEDESDDESANNAAVVRPMNSVWEYKYLCIKTQEDQFGKLIIGWTCGYCPCPGNVGGYVFQRGVNATKALAHVLKLAGQDVAICKGIIPYEKKMAYKALYNMNLVKKKKKKARDAALRGEIHSFQDQSLVAYFPQAVPAPRSQRKQPPEYPNGNGGYSLGGSTSLEGSTLATTPGQSSTLTSSASASSRSKLSVPPNSNTKKPHHQLKLYGNAILPEANQKMHIPIAAFIHGSAHPFIWHETPTS
jgi:hypothetical protein